MGTDAAAGGRPPEHEVRFLLRKLKRKGDRAVVHGLRQRPSNRKIAEGVRQRAMELVRTEYSDFGPTLASEYLRKQDKNMSRSYRSAAVIRVVSDRRSGTFHGSE